MAYQNVATPRFYINVFEWLNINGVLDVNDVFRTNPVNFKSYNNANYDISKDIFNDKAFIAILGHTLSSDGYDASLQSNSLALPFSEVVNIGNTANTIDPEYDGWSLATTDQLNGKEQVSVNLTTSTQVGSIILGNYYDMTHSPDLNLTMTREYGGVKTIETKGGASLSNSFYNGNPKWGDRGAWELELGYNSNVHSNMVRSGRRIWDLSFSYIDSSDIFGSNQLMGSKAYTTTSVDSDDLDANNNFNYNILNDDNFFSQVIHKTNGGQLPFIFQPDNTNNNVDQFAICKLDMKSFQFKQVANSVYNISLKIREVW